MQKRWSLSVPVDPFPLGEHGDIVREAWDLGYTDAWSAEIDGIDCFTPLAAVAAVSPMRVGTAIANVFSRGPAVLAQTAAGMAQLAPGRFQLGIGTGSEVTVESWNSMAFRKPLTRVRETTAFLRRALAGERVVFEGETIRVAGFRLQQAPEQPIPIHIAALREGMLRLAGEIGDGCIINWLSAEDVRKSVAVVREGAAAAGRDPASIEISARLMVCVDPPSEAADTGMRRTICGYLTVPVYAKFHEWLGRGEELRDVWDRWAAGDRRSAVAAIPSRTVDALMPNGSAEERRAHVLRYMDAGVDTAFFWLFSFETDPAKRRENVLRAIREMAPAAY